MQPWKIEHFERDNPGQPFPQFELLAEPGARSLLTNLASKAGLVHSADMGDLVAALYQKAGHVECESAEAQGFNLATVVAGLGLEPQPLVYVGGLEGPHSVIRLSFSDLSEHFEYIWYPASDDISIFDDTLSWLLFVNHEGELHFLRIVD